MCIYIKVLKPNEIFPRKKQTNFFDLRQYIAFLKFPSLCNSISILKLIYSLPGCLSGLHHLEQEILSKNFHKTFLAKFESSFQPHFWLKPNRISLKIFLSVSYLVSNGHLVLFLHKLVLHSILRPISAATIRIYSTGRDRSKL